MSISKVVRIPRGDRGIRKTAQAMRGLVHQSLTEPLTVETAGDIVAQYCCPPEKAQGIRDFLGAYVRYTPDPVGFELLRSPDYMLQKIFKEGAANGDCDDVAILGAALGMAVGLPASFVLVGFDRNEPFQHVYTELYTGLQGWAEMDVTAPAQMPAGLEIAKYEFLEV